MKQEDVMALMQELGLTEGDTWTRSDLLAHLHHAIGVQVDEIREPAEEGAPFTVLLRSGAEGARVTLTFEPRGHDRFSLSTGRPAAPSA